MSDKQYIPCGGCGATDPIHRCIGCFHPFEPGEKYPKTIKSRETSCRGVWVNPLVRLPENWPDDWYFKHWRYVSDHYKLETHLFEHRDGGLCKIGGTGRLEYHEVEWLDETTPTAHPKEDAAGSGEGEAAFALWLDEQRNSKSEVWNDARLIWGKDNAFEIAYNIYKSQNK